METADPITVDVPALEAVRPQVDAELVSFLERQRSEVAAVHEDGRALVDELLRLVGAGGKRIRPALCYWGHRAAGGSDGHPIVRAAASLELLHTFALVHDDVMDRSDRRRGVATTHARFSAAAPSVPDAGHHGTSIAILVGDVAAVLADRMFLEAGFAPEPTAAAKQRYDRMRVEMAVGQFLDLSTDRADVELASRISELKTGSYTIEGPLQIGALLAGAPVGLLAGLAAFGRPLGEAFQVRDDLAGLLEGEADLAQGRPTWILARARERLSTEEITAVSRGPADAAATTLRDAGVLDAAAHRANALVDDAIGALDGAGLADEPADALRSIARAVQVRPR
ncbi:MAG: polyprenyl synthetase family protein [Actinomycetota bacterium]